MPISLYVFYFMNREWETGDLSAICIRDIKVKLVNCGMCICWEEWINSNWRHQILACRETEITMKLNKIVRIGFLLHTCLTSVSCRHACKYVVSECIWYFVCVTLSVNAAKDEFFLNSPQTETDSFLMSKSMLLYVGGYENLFQTTAQS